MSRNVMEINGTVVEFRHVPKVASTTVKTMMITAKGIDWQNTPASEWGVHDRDRKIGHPARAEFWDSITTKKKPDIRFTVIRDPVKRFISGYTNRVLFYEKAPKMSFDEFVHLAPRWGNNGDLMHHLAPMVKCIGDEPGLYDKVFSISQVNNEVRKFLSDLSGVDIPYMERQTGGTENKRSIVPTKDQLKKIKTLYEKDYMVWWNKRIVPQEFEESQ